MRQADIEQERVYGADIRQYTAYRSGYKLVRQKKTQDGDTLGGRGVHRAGYKEIPGNGEHDRGQSSG